MATRNFGICTYPGCGALVQGLPSRCAKHPYPAKRWAVRGAAPARIHNAHWRKLRQMVLARWPVCVGCNTAASTEVDHVIAREDGGTDAFDNLRGMCRSCHASKTAKESAWRRRNVASKGQGGSNR